MQHYHGGSGILRQRFLQIDTEDCGPLTNMIHSGSRIPAVVSQTDSANGVLLVLEYVQQLVTELLPRQPVLSVQQK
jgi:hypothetical protein